MPSPSPQPPRRYVLLDRDGTIAVDKHYQRDPAETELFPGARAGLERLRRAGFGLVLVTNQSGIGRGFITLAEMEAVNRSVARLLGGEEVFAKMYACPHLPDDACDCRKPEPGMLLQAAAELGFRPEDAIMVGDRDCDIGMARAAGARAVLVRTGGGRECEAAGRVKADYVADDLPEAAEWIINHA